MKKCPVPVQKGKINPDQPSYRFQSDEHKNSQDKANHDLRRSGQTMTLHEPK